MNYSDFLRDRGIKITKGRIAILNFLANNNKSVTVDSIYEECKKDGVNINLSTVYRAVDLFEEKGIVDKFPLKEGRFSYRIKKEEHKHILQCSVCHKEVEVPCPMKQFEEIVQSETGFTLVEHNLVMKGVCKECNKKEHD